MDGDVAHARQPSAGARPSSLIEAVDAAHRFGSLAASKSWQSRAHARRHRQARVALDAASRRRRHRRPRAGTPRTSAATTAARCSRAGPTRARRPGARGSRARRSRSRPARLEQRASRTRSRSGPRNQRASGTAKPILGRYSTSCGRCGSIAFLSSHLPSPPRSLRFERQRGQPFDQRMVHQRLAHLERVRHAGAIDLGVDVADQIGLQVEVLDQRQRIVGVGAARHARGTPRSRGSRPARRLKAGEYSCGAHVVAEDRHAVEVGRPPSRAPAPGRSTWRAGSAAPSRPSG